MRLVNTPAVLKFATWSLRVRAHSRGHSPESGHYAFERAPGARWVGALSVVPRCLPDAFELRGWIHGLRGRSGSFYLRPPYHDEPSANPCTGALTKFDDCTQFDDGATFDDIWSAIVEGTALLNGAVAAGATSVTLDTISDAGLVTAGAYMRIGDRETGQLVQIVSVSGSTATIRPRLREAWADNTAVALGQPEALFRLANPVVPSVPLIVGRSLAFELEIEEAY